MTTLFIDLETYSECNLTRAGAHRYAEHPSTEVMLFGYAIDDGPAQVWDHTVDPGMPEDLQNAFSSDVPLIAHNSAFDRNVLLAHGMAIPLSRWRCSMAKALSVSLPGALAMLSQVLGLSEEQAKIADGKRLVQKFCKPAPANRKVRRYTRETDPQDWERFVEYCRRDVEALRIIWNKLPGWNYQGRELELWHLDQVINDRGIQIDTELTEAAIRACDRAQSRLAADTCERTKGEVQRASQHNRMAEHLLAAYGVELSDFKAATVEKALAAADRPAGARAILEIRQQAAKTSTTKYKALHDAVSADGRLRGALQFCGASRTGRWSGRKFQPQNLPARGLPPIEDIELGIAAMKANAEDLICEQVMPIAAGAVRGTVIASPGKKLVVSDLSGIEGRKASWLAGEEWKLEAYRAFDVGEGPDLYNVTAGSILGKPPEDADKAERQAYGKVPDLACAYGGGVGAFQAMAIIYGVDMAAAWPTIQVTLDREFIHRAEDAYHKRGKRSGLPHDVWAASEAVKLAWRDRHPAISSYWYELERAAVKALNCPGTTIPCRKLQFRKEGGWLLLRLPSGRLLCYPQPRLNDDGQLTYMGMNQYTRRWERLSTFGGKLLENATQAASRDVLRDGMFRAEEAGYAIVFTVHDELVVEAPDDERYSEPHLSALLSVVPGWAEGLPLAASGFESYRYRKE